MEGCLKTHREEHRHKFYKENMKLGSCKIGQLGMSWLKAYTSLEEEEEEEDAVDVSISKKYCLSDHKNLH